MDNIDYSQASIALQLLLGGIIILVVKFSVPSYLKKKGENQATKEDIGQLTEIVKRVENKFGKDLEQFKSDLDFRKSINISIKTEEKNVLSNYHGLINEWIFKLFSIDLHKLRKLTYLEIKEVRENMDMFHQASLMLSKVRLTVVDDNVIRESRNLLDAAIRYRSKIEYVLQGLEHKKHLVELKIKTPVFPPSLLTAGMLANFNAPPNEIEVLNSEIDKIVEKYTRGERIKYFKEVQAIDEKYVDLVKKYLKPNSSE